MIDVLNEKGSFLFVEIGAVNPNDAAQKDEGHRRHGHHSVVEVAHVVHGIGNELKAEQRSATEEFAYGTHQH